jgi:hypothetical protein
VPAASLQGADVRTHSLGPIETRKGVLLDRLHTHTTQCSACRGARRNTRVAKVALGYLVLAAVTVLNAPPASALAAVTGRWAALLRGTTLGGAALAGLLHVLEKKWFVFTDYVHAQK